MRTADRHRAGGTRTFTRFGAGALAVAVCAAAGVLAAGTPAWAHDRLLSSTPEDGTDLDTAPSEIVLTFSGSVLDIGAAVAVLDGDSRQVADGAVAIDGPEVARRLPEDLPDGGYAVRWRVVSSDGHPISGSFTFTAGDAAAVPPALAPASAEPADDASEPAVAARPPVPDGTPGVPRTLLPASAGAGAGLAVYLIATALTARRSRPKPPPP
ncbi:copper resistance protein CopC [Nocardiopsis mangrovi]|uniref:Copper resistance protein CopC n=1 Tax=Nocardiopsis mangrovi TaxID=1179818 RepID=A0ABV9E4D6_9ACTN